MAKSRNTVTVEDTGTLCGWCDGTKVDRGRECPLCLGVGRRFATDEDKARWKALYTPKKKKKKK